MLTQIIRKIGIAAATVCLAATLQAQQRPPYVGYIYPAGGRQGSSFMAAISGQYLAGVTNIEVSGDGVRVSIVEYVKSIGVREGMLMRDRLDNIQSALKSSKNDATMITVQSEEDEKVKTKMYRSAALKEVAELKHKLANPKNGARVPNPQLKDDLFLKFTISASAKPGDRELRLMTADGLSNPVVFRVGTLPEFSYRPQITMSGPGNPIANLEKFGQLYRFMGGGDGNASVMMDGASPTMMMSSSSGGDKMMSGSAMENMMMGGGSGDKSGSSRGSEPRVTIPCVVNGQIMPSCEARYVFTAHQGQKLVISASARQLIPYIADAVPGWFQAALAIYDADGKEVAYDDDFRFNPDPVIYLVVPKSGDYYVTIKDAIYRGREDFVYRITISELPFVTSIFPLGGRLGETKTLALTGWNLPSTNLDVTFNESGIQYITPFKGDTTANRVPFMVDTLPESLEQEPNDLMANAQKLTLPAIVNGRIDLPGDIDVFRFEGAANQKIVAEVYARRLNSPLDSVLKLTDANGKQLAFNDDFEDRRTGLNTHHADSYISYTLPAKGTYYLHLSDPQRKGGPDYAYRLRVSAPRPDFALRASPASLSMRPGSSATITVYAMRQDGFTGDIAITPRDLPSGFKLSNGKIPSSTNAANFTLTAPGKPYDAPVKISLDGRATIAGGSVVRAAVPSSDMMQAFAYRHLVPCQSLEVAVLNRPKSTPSNNNNKGTPTKTTTPTATPAKTTTGKPATTASTK